MSNRTVWKFHLPLGDEVSVVMPAGANPIHVDMQHNEPHVWAIVCPDNHRVKHRFRVAGTGHPIRDVGFHVGTFHLGRGTDAELVFHVFDMGETNEQ